LCTFLKEKLAPLNCENQIDWKPTLLLERETAAPSSEEDVELLNFVDVSLNDDVEILPPSESPDNN
jgi:hypothetical protein